MVLPRRPQRSGCACLSWGLVLLKPHREGMWGQQSERGQGGHWGCGGGLWVGTCIGINWTPEITTASVQLRVSLPPPGGAAPWMPSLRRVTAQRARWTSQGFGLPASPWPSPACFSEQKFLVDQVLSAWLSHLQRTLEPETSGKH